MGHVHFCMQATHHTVSIDWHPIGATFIFLTWTSRSYFFDYCVLDCPTYSFIAWIQLTSFKLTRYCSTGVQSPLWLQPRYQNLPCRRYKIPSLRHQRRKHGNVSDWFIRLFVDFCFQLSFFKPLGHVIARFPNAIPRSPFPALLLELSNLPIDRSGDDIRLEIPRFRKVSSKTLPLSEDDNFGLALFSWHEDL